MQTINLSSVTLTFEPGGIRIKHTKTGASFLVPLDALERWALSKLRGQI